MMYEEEEFYCIFPHSDGVFWYLTLRLRILRIVYGWSKVIYKSQRDFQVLV